MWTEAVFSASVRIEWERGPISRNLFISMVKSLEDRKDLMMETSITCSICATDKNEVFTENVQQVQSEFKSDLIIMPVFGEIQEHG